MIRRLALLSTVVVFVLASPSAAAAASEDFGIESVANGFSTTQAGDHPDFTFDVAVKQDPTSAPNVFGLRDSYATTRNIRVNVPPGLIGDPNVLGVPQQCTAQELVALFCPNGSQVGLTTISAYQLTSKFREPLYMMQPPGGDVIARLGTVAGIYPTFIDLRVRSEGDYGLVSEVRDAPTAARLIGLGVTLWGVPADPSHDNERCTPPEVFSSSCVTSPARPPGSRPLPFMTNPTRCGVPLEMGVNASSWLESDFDPLKEVTDPFPTFTGCDHLPFGPSLTVEPTNDHTSSPTGLDMTIRLPASAGAEVLEPAQTRDIRIALPEGIAFNPGAADGLAVCSAEQVRFKKREDAHCPDASKMAATEFEVAALSRRMKGAVYLREPEPGNLFRIWVVADDLGAHVKLPGQLEVDRSTGQIKSVVLDSPQVPLREVKLLFKSGFRAPLMTPASCEEYLTHYEFSSWAGGSPAVGDTPMRITEGCEGGGFSPKLSAGSTQAQGGAFSPFTFTVSREDSEQNLAGLNVTLPRGMAASFAGIPRCDGADAQSGRCPAASRIGKTVVADGAGPAPLWVPQPGKDPTAIYLAGPYKGAPFSIVAVVPAQAGPFDLGDEVVRSAVYVDPVTAQATAKADPLPQFIEGIPITYKAVNVEIDRPGFTLNPTSCAKKETTATLISAKGREANPSSPFAAVNCAKLGFKPKISFRLSGGTHRGSHPGLRAVVRPRPGDANFAGASVALPHSEFLDQGSIGTVCTRVQFAARSCPAASIYGHVAAKTPLLDETLSGPIYLRSSSHLLPDLVAVLRGPDSLPIETNLVGRVDSINGGIRNTFNLVPDVPVSWAAFTFAGGKKGLLENSTDICIGAHRATAQFKAQNGRRLTIHPALKASCHQGARPR